jgi:hypothetical protein
LQYRSFQDGGRHQARCLPRAVPDKSGSPPPDPLAHGRLWSQRPIKNDKMAATVSPAHHHRDPSGLAAGG